MRKEKYRLVYLNHHGTTIYRLQRWNRFKGMFFGGWESIKDYYNDIDVARRALKAKQDDADFEAGSWKVLKPESQPEKVAGKLLGHGIQIEESH